MGIWKTANECPYATRITGAPRRCFDHSRRGRPKPGPEEARFRRLSWRNEDRGDERILFQLTSNAPNRVLVRVRT
jgi:hypothetical protein